MTSNIDKVRQFHEKYGHPVADKPGLIPDSRFKFRVRLIQEELGEYEEAANDYDLTGIVDALADLLYVVYGTAVEHGVDVDGALAEAHRSNMTKEMNGLGKPIKGAAFEEPDFTPFTT